MKAFAFVVYLSFLVLLTLQQTRSFGCMRTLRKAGEEQLSASISGDAGEQDRDDLRRRLIFGRYYAAYHFAFEPRFQRQFKPENL